MAYHPEQWYKIGGTYITPNDDVGIKLTSDVYINFGDLYGSPGYGLRDDSGTMQFKNDGGAWSNLGSGTGGGGGISWSEVTANTTMAVGTGSLANKATLLTLTLPATSAVGETVRVAGMNAGLWKVAQAANQYIKFGNQNTTTGTGGSLASVSTYDAVELVCIEANVGWVVVSSQGNITVT